MDAGLTESTMDAGLRDGAGSDAAGTRMAVTTAPRAMAWVTEPTATMARLLPWAGGLVAGLLAFLLGRGRSLWFDEGYTAMVERLPFADMMRWLAVDAHPPLHYLLLRAWMAVSGDSFAAMRALSAVCCGLAVVATAALVRCVSDERHMVLALPVLVLGPLALRYGYEIRMYALLMLLAALGTLALLHAVRAEEALKRDADADAAAGAAGARWRVWAWWVLYAVVVCLGMLTQYLIAFLWIVQAGWLLARTLRARRRGGAVAWRWLAAYALAELRHNVLPGLKGLFGPGRLAELVTAWLTGLDATHLSGFVTLGLLAVAGLLLWSRPRVAAAWRPLVLMWVAPTLLLLVVTAVREPFCPLYDGFITVRYSCAFLPFVYATLGLVVADLALRRDGAGERGGDGTPGGDGAPGGGRAVRAWCRRWGAWVAVVAMMAAGDMGLAAHGNVIYEKGYTPHARQAAAAAPCSPGAAVVASDPYTYIDAAAYYRGCADYWLIEPEGGIPSRGGYAPLAEVARGRVIRSLDDLPDGLASITVLVGDGARPGSFATPRHPKEGVERVGEYTVLRFR